MTTCTCFLLNTRGSQNSPCLLLQNETYIGHGPTIPIQYRTLSEKDVSYLGSLGLAMALRYPNMLSLKPYTLSFKAKTLEPDF